MHAEMPYPNAFGPLLKSVCMVPADCGWPEVYVARGALGCWSALFLSALHTEVPGLIGPPQDQQVPLASDRRSGRLLLQHFPAWPSIHASTVAA